MSENERPPNQLSDRSLNDLEAALAELVPAARLDRDRALFAAGRASRPWFWPAVSASLAAALLISCGVFTFFLATYPNDVGEPQVHVETPDSSPSIAAEKAMTPDQVTIVEPSLPAAIAANWRLRRQVMAELTSDRSTPTAPPSSEPNSPTTTPNSYWQLRRSILDG